MHVLHPLLRQNKVYIHSFPVAQFIFQPLAILLIDVQNSEFAMYDLTEMILFWIKQTVLDFLSILFFIIHI